MYSFGGAVLVAPVALQMLLLALVATGSSSISTASASSSSTYFAAAGEGSLIEAAAAAMTATAAQRPNVRNLRNAGSGPPARALCLNTCNKARNGVCEEGRPGRPGGSVQDLKTARFMVYCDLGTDCEDCGPWVTTAATVPWEPTNAIGPIRFLKARDVQVRVREADVPAGIRFAFAYTDPQYDYDVSYHLDKTGIVEAGITAIAYRILRAGPCLREDGSRALVVDVGSNFGWFSVLAARMGCRVIAFEPVPLFRAFLEYNVHLNDLSNLVQIRTSVVSHEAGKTLKMVVPSRGIWGTAGIEGLNIDTSIQSDHNTIEVPSVRLEDEIKADVLLLKVDVEGWEWSVMLGAGGLLRNHKVENIVMEYSPGVPERHFKFDHMAAHPAMLSDLVRQYRYRIGHIGDASKHQSAGWEAPLAPLREVTSNNLKYDSEDVKRWEAGQLACPVPPSLANFSNWKLCGGVPEGLSPRSFRSDFTHNTNIWAARSASTAAPPGSLEDVAAAGGGGGGGGGGRGGGGSLLRLRGQSGILDPADPREKYFQTSPEGFGMGSRVCRDINPLYQVKHRCRCSNSTVCGAEEAAALKAAAAGTIAQNYVLP